MSDSSAYLGMSPELRAVLLYLEADDRLQRTPAPRPEPDQQEDSCPELSSSASLRLGDPEGAGELLTEAIRIMRQTKADLWREAPGAGPAAGEPG
jgi:hypothetical protein